jgi:hypothetical protein
MMTMMMKKKKKKKFLHRFPRPDRLCGPPNLLSNGYEGLLPWG